MRLSSLAIFSSNSPEPSTEASSTMMSCWTGRCESTSQITSSTVARSLKTGMTMDTQGDTSSLNLTSGMNGSMTLEEISDCSVNIAENDDVHYGWACKEILKVIFEQGRFWPCLLLLDNPNG